MARTKTNTWNSTKYAEQHDVKYVYNKLCVCVCFLFFIVLFFRFLKMISQRNVKMTHWLKHGESIHVVCIALNFKVKRFVLRFATEVV